MTKSLYMIIQEQYVMIVQVQVEEWKVVGSNPKPSCHGNTCNFYHLFTETSIYDELILLCSVYMYIRQFKFGTSQHVQKPISLVAILVPLFAF